MSGSPTAVAPPHRCWPCARAVSRARASGSASPFGNGATARPGIVCSVAHEKPHHGLGRGALLPRRPVRAPADDRRSVLDRLGAGRRLERQRAGPGRCGLPRRGRGSLRRRPRAASSSPALAGPIHWPWSWPTATRPHRAVLVGDAARGIHPDRRPGLEPGAARRRGGGRDRGRPAAPRARSRRCAWRSSATPPGGGSTAWRWWRSPTGSTACSPTIFCRCAWRVRPGSPPSQQMAPLKRYFMQHAMGLVGDLPRAMRGLPL